MSTVKEIKNYTLSQLKSGLEYPGMFSSCVADQELLYRTFLDLLSFIDGKSESAEPWFTQLLHHYGFWASRGARSPFLSRAIEQRDFRESLAVVYAQVAHSSGYVEFDRTVESEQFGLLERWCADEMQHENWHESELIERFGQPSFSTKGSYARGLLYSTGEKKQWVGFLFTNQWEKGEGDDYSKPIWGDDPILYYAFMSGKKPCQPRILWTKYGRDKKGLVGIQK